MVGYSGDCCECTRRALALPCDCCALRAGFNSITTAANGFVRSPAVPITERCSLLAETSPRPPPGEGALSSVRLRERPGRDPRALEPGGAASHVSRARMAFLAGPRLLDWASCPPHLQFNKFVLTGYRPEASGGECVRSLFYLHNELGNIYTHGIPLLGFIFLLPLSMPWSQITVSWLGVVHYLACITPQLGSVLYHLFMNHKGGAPVYHTLLTVDMCGVCMVNTLGALPIIYVTLLCYPSTRSAALLMYTCLSSYAIYCAITASSNVTRLRSFAWQAFFRFLFFYLRWVGLGTGHPSSLQRYLVMDSLALLGGMINISRIPERWKPGKFDYWFNSHQIMHVLAVLSITYLHWGVVSDLLWVTTHVCPGD